MGSVHQRFVQCCIISGFYHHEKGCKILQFSMMFSLLLINSCPPYKCLCLSSWNPEGTGIFPVHKTLHCREPSIIKIHIHSYMRLFNNQININTTQKNTVFYKHNQNYLSDQSRLDFSETLSILQKQRQVFDNDSLKPKLLPH